MSLLSALLNTKRPSQPAFRGDGIDTATGLPSRASVISQVEVTLKEARRKRPVSLLIIDFTNIESSQVEGADSLLPTLADLLRSWVPQEHLVGRMRDREFGVLIGSGVSLSSVDHLAGQIVDRLRETSLLQGRQRSIVTNIGISHSSAAACSATELLRNADIALARARAGAQAHYVVVDRVPR